MTYDTYSLQYIVYDIMHIVPFTIQYNTRLYTYSSLSTIILYYTIYCTTHHNTHYTNRNTSECNDSKYHNITIIIDESDSPELFTPHNSVDIRPKRQHQWALYFKRSC